MLDVHLLLPAALRPTLGVLKRFLGLFGKAIDVHFGLKYVSSSDRRQTCKGGAAEHGGWWEKSNSHAGARRVSEARKEVQRYKEVTKNAL
jgi:hypothetical protein